MTIAGPAAMVRRWLEPFACGPLVSGAGPAGRCALLEWAASGAMHLTGRPDGPPELFHRALLPLLAAAAGSSAGEGFAAHVQQFGVPAAALPPVLPDVVAPWSVTTIAAPRAGLRLDGALVVDLSSLWAGPLCAHLLANAGATVIKV